MASRPRSRRRERSDTAARVLAAIPAIAFAIFIVSQGGIVFALGLIALGVLAMVELYTMMERVRPPNLAGFVTLVALVLTALYGTKQQVLLVLVLSVPLTFFVALLRPRREHISWAMAVVFLGILWIGVAVAHGVFLREMHHGGGLVLDVLIGTFIGDTAAYFGGRAWGRRPLAPRISPNKTLEGLVTGVVGGTVAFWLFAIAYQHEWFKGPDALLIGFVVALVGPIGDLFESAIKRDLDVKDTGRFFGAHGGVLDRVDAVLFTLVAGYYMAQAVLG
ncbi:MAG: phosphatidate cytidylyltransferase [Thermoleophilaceae bacterium]|nr:phosphatidate cytidylyltransferase [Thermoleophilaceae bacterium]